MRKCVGFFFPPEFHIPISIPHMGLFFKLPLCLKLVRNTIILGSPTQSQEISFKDEGNAEFASMFASRETLSHYTLNQQSDVKSYPIN